MANRVFTRKTAHIVTAATAADTPRTRSLTAFIVYPIWALKHYLRLLTWVAFTGIEGNGIEDARFIRLRSVII